MKHIHTEECKNHRCSTCKNKDNHNALTCCQFDEVGNTLYCLWESDESEVEHDG